MDDFEDDGGTRAWRADQRTWADPIVLDIRPRGRVPQSRRGSLAAWTIGWFMVGISPGILAILAILAAWLGTQTSTGSSCP